MTKSLDQMVGLEERLRKSANPIIEQWDEVKNKVAHYELELGRNVEAHVIFDGLF